MKRGLRRKTLFGDPSELIDTHYGLVSRRYFLQQEARRFTDGQVVERGGKVALYAKGKDT